MVSSKAKTVEKYLLELPEERRVVIEKLRNLIKNNLPAGFEEMMSYGMIGYNVPLSRYPSGYHCNGAPLPFLSIASQKHYIALYHMGLYSNKSLSDWFVQEYTKTGFKLDKGASCIRWKNFAQIPYELIEQLVSKITPDEWIRQYESTIRKK